VFHKKTEVSLAAPLTNWMYPFKKRNWVIRTSDKCGHKIETVSLIYVISYEFLAIKRLGKKKMT